MAAAKKCDICGKLYELYNMEDDEENVNGLKLLNIDGTGRYFEHGSIDCCPACMSTIVGLIKGDKKEE